MKKYELILIVLLVILGIYFYPRQTVVTIDKEYENYVSTATTSILKLPAEVVNTTGQKPVSKIGGIEYTTVESKLVKPNIPQPLLDRPINFPIVSNAEYNKMVEQKINTIIARLKKAPLLFDDWNSLGQLWQSIDDYEGAKEAFVYASALSPSNPIPFHQKNLSRTR